MLLGLQRTAGNRAVGALLGRRRRAIQRTPLIESDYASLKQLYAVINVTRRGATTNWGGLNDVPAEVEVSVPDFEGSNVLSMGTAGQAEIEAASAGGWQAQAALGAAHPELAWHKGALEGIRRISFVRRNVAETAIGKLSDLMAENVGERANRPNTKDRTKEGIRNMFLHVFGQALITTIWGRAAADLSGDIHERDQPALITGAKVTGDAERQAIDNYCDMINNIHGQAWGELLAASLKIDGDTVWSPALVARYANDLQAIVAGSMKWKTKAEFRSDDLEIIKFSRMLNEVLHGTVVPPRIVPGTPPAKKP
jgi:hypothetical protein